MVWFASSSVVVFDGFGFPSSLLDQTVSGQYLNPNYAGLFSKQFIPYFPKILIVQWDFFGKFVKLSKIDENLAILKKVFSNFVGRHN